MSYSVSDLYFYPIKSLGPIPINSMEVDSFGPFLDRRIMLVDTNGKFITQRQCPIMSLIKVELIDKRFQLSLNEDSVELLLPDFSQKTESVSVTVWDDTVSGQLIVGEASSWLSKKLNQPVRLVYMDQSEFRQVDLTYARPGIQTSFSDGFPFLLISQASIDFLSEKVGFDLLMQRFRPNIVVTGCKAFEEDTWKKIKIGDVVFDLVKPCSRCVIPTIDTVTGEKQKEVMQAMLKYRRKEKGVFVGQNLIHTEEGVLDTGFTVEVLELF
jgi:uncharacterized protein YcbX